MGNTGKYDFSTMIPAFVLELAVQDGKAKTHLPIVTTQMMGVLFLDVSGFTRFTEFASSKGHYGVENITGLLNRYFDLLACILTKYGGQIAKYGGDSCLAVFPGEKAQVMPALSACRDEIKTRIGEFGLAQKQEIGVDFRIHGGMAYGEVITHIVGSIANSLNYFLSGCGIAEAYHLDEGNTAGEIVLSPDITSFVSVIRAKKQTDDKACEYYPPPVLPTKLKNYAGNFIPEAVRAKLTSSGSSAELRNAAIIFINISAGDKMDVIDPADYQQIFTRIQGWVKDFDGTVNKIDFSDKGYLIIIAFGAPQSHPDMVERAFLCAWRINQIKTDLHLKTGITSCNIYAGIIGAKRCFEYGIIGNGVNIAARLMSHASAGEIMLSDSIVPRIRNRFEVSFVQETEVKGIGNRIKMYRLVRELPENWSAMQQNYSPFPVLARQEIITQMREKIQHQTQQLFVIYGPSGSGKSFLIYQVSRDWVESGKSVFYYSSDQIASKRRLEIFFQIIRRQLGIVYFAQEIEILKQWAIEKDINLDVKLLKKWLFANQDKEKETYTAADVSYEHTLFLEMLSAVLEKLLSDSELIILDNLESADSESLALINRLVPKLYSAGKNIILSGSNAGIAEPFNLLEPQTVPLNPFSMKETVALAQFVLPNIAPQAITRIHALTEGNPLFINELCQSLKAQLKDTHDLFTEASLKEVENRGLLPESLENLFIRRYDALDDAPKSVLKLAAILAKGFTASEMLTYLFKQHHDKLPASLELLIGMRLLIITTIDPQTTYAFTNNIMRESIYRTILLSEKKQIHGKIASSLIQSLGAEVYDYLEVIADHYIKAEDSPNVYIWAAKAGNKLLALADYEHCVAYFLAAIASATEENTLLMLRLSLFEAYIFQAKMTEAEQILPLLDAFSGEKGLIREKYIWLCVRYYAYTTQYEEALEYINSSLDSISDTHYLRLLQIDRLDCLFYTNRSAEFENEAKALYASLDKAEDEIYKGRLASILGQYYLKQGYYATAGEYYQVRKIIAQKLKDYLGERIALSSLGIVASRSGDKKTARMYYEKALALAEKHGDRNIYSKVLLDIGTLYRNEEKYDQALDCYERSLKLTDITQNKIQYTTVLYDIGELHYYKLEYDIAMDYYRRSLEISEKIGDEMGVSFCCDAIGDILYRLKRYKKAEAVYRKNLELQLRINDREGIAHSWGNLGNIEKVRKNYEQAIINYHKQIDILAEVGDKDGTGRAWFNLAMVDVTLKDFPAAMEKLKTAEELFTECGAQQNLDITRQQIEKIARRRK